MAGSKDGWYRIDGVAGIDEPGSGGPEFVLYCWGAAARASARRRALDAAFVEYRRSVRFGRAPYPSALMILQRTELAIADLTRLLVGLDAAKSGESDAFDRVRGASTNNRSQLLERLVLQAAYRSELLNLGGPDTSSPPDLIEALAAANEVNDKRWLAHLVLARDGWRPIAKIGKASRHGMPILPKGLIQGVPGAGLLSERVVGGSSDWVALPQSKHDPGERSITTKVHAVATGETALSEARAAALAALSLTVELASVHRMQVSGTLWMVPRKTSRKLDARHRATLRREGGPLDLSAPR